MGCVTSKGLGRGPDRVSWYSRMSRNESASVKQHFDNGEKDIDHDHVVALKASSYGNLGEQTCHGSFLNMRNNIKQYKMLPPDTEVEESFTFTSNLDGDYTRTYGGTEPIMPTFVCENIGTMSVGLQSSREPDIERKHYLMCDYLDIEHMVVYKGSKGSLWEDGGKGLLASDVSNSKNVRSYAGTEWVTPGNEKKNLTKCNSPDVSHVVHHEAIEPGKVDDERKSLLSDNGHDTEIIDMQELMEGLEDTSKTPSPRRSRVFGTLSIPEREISFNALPDFMSAPGGDLGSPVWKKYYMQDKAVVSTNTWNVHSPETGSPFNDSPRRALSQSSFNDVDDTRSVSSMEVPDANAIGLKILLSPASSSFHPSPVNWAHSSFPSSDGNFHGSYTTTVFSDGNSAVVGDLFDVATSPYRSRKPSTESSTGSIGHECVDSGMRDPFRSPNLTRSNSSVYGSGSPLFDPSLMTTFEEALKASTGVPAYDDWLRFSIDESLTMSSSSANTLESFDKVMDAESIPTEQRGMSMIPSYELQINKKAALASYDFRCPPRGEGKVVLYFTSLRGVRKTYENCVDIRLVLRGLGVHVDERDVWMHSQFRSELTEVLNGLFKGVPQVPQLFIKGRYIGGADVVMQLHEEGSLSCLMEGLAMGLIHSICNGCGDARFIPCFTCNGSCKVINAVNKVTQCVVCNENGLIMCPMCNT